MAKFDQGFLDSIRDRVPLVDLVGSSVALKRAGREWKGLCPFHKEKTPSFMVSETRWHCFGCQKHGDQFGWAMEKFGYTFPDAVRWLADQAGVNIPEPDRATQEQEGRQRTLLAVLASTQRYYQRQLGDNHRAYLTSRGVTPEQIEAFGIGYAPDKPLQFQHADIVEAAGLIKMTPHGPRQIFRDRIMFPIRDRRGQTIAFGGRAFGDFKPPYLNSPQTETFDKSRTLFNVPAHPVEGLTVVEGYFDALAADRAGLPAVATMGTALSADHLRTLWRLCDLPVVCFDGDTAGQRAALRAIETAFPVLVPGKSLRFATLPAGKDPDDIARERGVEALRSLVTGAEGLADTFWRLSSVGRSVGSPDDRAALESQMLAKVQTIAHEGLRRRYAQDVRDRLFRLPRPSIVRSNGHTLHSASPGAFRLQLGYTLDGGFSLKEAALINQVAGSPLSTDVEAIALDRTLSARARKVVADLVEAACDGRPMESDAVAEARGVLRGVGLAV